MPLPQELEVWYVLPALRRALALELKKLGNSQKKISTQLGITESAVSQYLSKKRGTELLFPQKIRLELVTAAKTISTGGDALTQLMKLTDRCRQEKVLCQLHKQQEHVPENCKICLE